MSRNLAWKMNNQYVKVMRRVINNLILVLYPNYVISQRQNACGLVGDVIYWGNG